MQLVARPHWPRPDELAAKAENAASRPEFAADDKAHGQRGGVPAAGREPGERRFLCRSLVEMKGLRVIAGGEFLDLGGADSEPVRGEFLTDREVLEILHQRLAGLPENQAPDATAAATVAP